jgi:hypothetical protein
MRGVLAVTAFFIAGLLQPGASALESDWMSDSDLTETFKGKSVAGLYENGETFEESYGADGRVNYSDKDRMSGGKWSVQSGSFCTIYDDDPSGGCFRVRREGANCYEFYFIARDEVQADKNPRKPDWTAVAWFKGKVPTCKAGETV